MLKSPLQSYNSNKRFPLKIGGVQNCMKEDMILFTLKYFGEQEACIWIHYLLNIQKEGSLGGSNKFNPFPPTNANVQVKVQKKVE